MLDHTTRGSQTLRSSINLVIEDELQFVAGDAERGEGAVVGIGSVRVPRRHMGDDLVKGQCLYGAELPTFVLETAMCDNRGDEACQWYQHNGTYEQPAQHADCPLPGSYPWSRRV